MQAGRCVGRIPAEHLRHAPLGLMETDNQNPRLNLISMEGSSLKQGETQIYSLEKKRCEISLARLGSAFKLQQQCLRDSSALHRSFSPSLGFKPVNSRV